MSLLETSKFRLRNQPSLKRMSQNAARQLASCMFRSGWHQLPRVLGLLHRRVDTRSPKSLEVFEKCIDRVPIEATIFFRKFE